MVHLTRLPIPEAREASRVSRRNELSVGTDRHINRVTRIVVAEESLFAILSEPVGRRVNDDLVVGRLESCIFAGRM